MSKNKKKKKGRKVRRMRNKKIKKYKFSFDAYGLSLYVYRITSYNSYFIMHKQRKDTEKRIKGEIIYSLRLCA